MCTDFKPGPFSRMKHSSSKVKSSVGWQVLRADESQQGARGMMIPGHAKFAMLAASTIFSVRAAERLVSEVLWPRDNNVISKAVPRPPTSPLLNRKYRQNIGTKTTLKSDTLGGLG